ncbi:MAG: MFS transporter [Patescibacteria group bacterium]|nr:MFS transporter [Patescibacteria group bacterium]
MHQGEHHEIQHHQYRLRFTELNEIYIFNSLRSLAFTFIANFIPIYILLNKGDIKYLFYYYIIMYGFEAILGPFIARLIKRIGPKHVISYCVPFLLMHFFLLQTLETYNWSVWWLALSGSFALALFWQAYHYDFSRAKHRKRATREVTTQYILLYVLAIIAPFLGGYLMDNGGPLVAFGAAIGLLLIGTLALFRTSDKHEEAGDIDVSRLEIRSVAKDAVSYAGYSIEGFVGMTFWQLFVFMIVGNYRDVGLAVSAMLFISVFIMYRVGKKSDGNISEKIKYIRYGGIGRGIFGAGRIFVTSLFGVYFINFARTIFGSLLTTPWISEYYLHADEESRSEYIMIMEMTASFSKVALCVLMLGLSFYLSLESLLIFGLVMGGVGSIISGFMPRAKCEVKLNKEELKIMPKPQKRGADA